MWSRRTRPHRRVSGTLELGDDVELRDGPIRTHLVVQSGGHLKIGRETTIDYGCGLACESRIDIGSNVTIGPFVQILDTAFHQTASVRSRPEAQPVVVGDRAVIGAWATLLPGAVVDADEVVPPNTTVIARRR